jgi:hypothetical protein
MRHKQQYDGEWIFPRRKNYYMQCCDCGLTHRINFKLVKDGRGRQIAFQAFRIRKRRASKK